MTTQTVADKAKEAIQVSTQNRAVSKEVGAKRAIQDFLTKYKDEIALAARTHLTPEKIIRIAMTSISRQPKLQECTPATILGAIIQSSQLGLEPNDVLGHAYLVPFRNNKNNTTECQLIIGYKGYIALARRSGDIASITAQVVYEGDVFEYEYGLNEKLKHVPNLDGDRDQSKIRFVYAYATFRDGGYAFEVIPRKEIDRIMLMTKSKGTSGVFGPWKDNYEEMARKSAIRKLSKYLPITIEMANAVHMDERTNIDPAAGVFNVEKVDKDTGEIATETAEYTDLPSEEEEAQKREKVAQTLLSGIKAAKNGAMLEQYATQAEAYLNEGQITEEQFKAIGQAISDKRK